MHGLSHTRRRRILTDMKTRCYNSSRRDYRWYGAKGIKVCEEWLNDFQAFYYWAEDNGYESHLTIDRKDVNGDYCPENCRWVTRARNIRRAVRYRKLTDRDKRIICRSRRKVHALSKRFKVSVRHIYYTQQRHRENSTVRA